MSWPELLNVSVRNIHYFYFLFSIEDLKVLFGKVHSRNLLFPSTNIVFLRRPHMESHMEDLPADVLGVYSPNDLVEEEDEPGG